MKSLVNTLKHWVGNKLFVKFILLFSIVYILTMFVMGALIVKKVTLILMERETRYEKQVMLQIMKYLEDLDRGFKEINDDLLSNYYGKKLPLVEFFQLNPQYGDLQLYHTIIQHLEAVKVSNANILDIIVIQAPDRYIAVSSQDGIIDLTADFDEYEWYRGVAGSQDNSVAVHYSDRLDYILRRNCPALTYAGKLRFTRGNTQEQLTLVVNYKIDELDRIIRKFEQMEGFFMVFTGDGTTIYDSTHQYDGKKYQYFDFIRSSSGMVKMPDGNEVSVQNLSYNSYTVSNIITRNKLQQRTQSIISSIVVILLLLLFILIGITVLVANISSRAVQRIIKSMKKVEKGELDVRIDLDSSDELGQIAVSFNKMCDRLDTYIKKVYVAEIKQQDAKLSALQMQINPHFLFNTLETMRMKAVINEDDELASMTLNLSNLFRWVMRVDSTIITIEEEMEFLYNYLELLEYRLEGMVDYDVDVDESILGFGIIKFTLQPIIENAVVHGLEKNSGRGVINVKGRLEKENIVFEVRDNGGIGRNELENMKNILKDYGNKEGSIGLKNVQERIQILYGSEYGLDFDIVDGFTVVSVQWPAKIVQEG